MNERRRASRRWLAGAWLLAFAAVITGFVVKPMVPDPMPAEWLSPANRSEGVRRDSLLYFAYPVLATGLCIAGAVIARAFPRWNLRTAPVLALSTFILTAFCANAAVLSWLRPHVFSAWLGIVYLALLVGLVANHARSRHSRPRGTETPTEGSS